MQLTLLIVNFFLITIISREYGAEIYGEYASSKSLSVLIGTAIVMSLALVVTKALAKNNNDAKLLFVNSYYIITRNFFISAYHFKNTLFFMNIIIFNKVN